MKHSLLFALITFVAATGCSENNMGNSQPALPPDSSVVGGYAQCDSHDPAFANMSVPMVTTLNAFIRTGVTVNCTKNMPLNLKADRFI
ncbi:MAG: hypothetical protein ACOY3E_03305 [Pseudomonadota bacterium]